MTGADPTPRPPRVEATKAALDALFEYEHEYDPAELLAEMERRGLVIATLEDVAKVARLNPETTRKRLREAQGGD